MAMTFIRRLSLPACALIAILLLVGVAYNLVTTQDKARSGLRAELENRAQVVSRVMRAIFDNDLADRAAKAFAVPDREIPAAIEGYQGTDPSPRIVILDARGRLLGASPRSVLREQGLVQRSPHLTAALAGGNTISGIFEVGDGQLLLERAVRFKTKYGTRVIGEALPAQAIQSFADGFMEVATGVTGSRALLLDARGKILASTNAKSELGSQLDEPDVVDAMRSGHSVEVGSSHLAWAAVPGAGWRVVVIAPTKALYASVNGSTRAAAWRLFGAFALALAALLAIGAATVRQSNRLAHQRLHDALTGLPNRTLFLKHLDRTLQRADKPVAVLFADLDHFKTINDTLGHEAGDELLVGVAARIAESVRPGDSICRFGGDEFLALLHDVPDVDTAHAVAERLEESVAEPFVIGSELVSVGCSVGTIFHPADDATSSLDMIHEADQAMYRAKNSKGHNRRPVAT